MIKKPLLLIVSILVLFHCMFPAVVSVNPGEIYQENIVLNYRNVTVYAPAVAQGSDAYFGVISTITITIQSNGSGRVFVDTLPLTQIDMQGSARLAVKVASALVKNDQHCRVDPNDYDYFFVVRTASPIIGGPSAGGIMTAAVVALLQDWNMDNQTVMTGMINPDGSIGSIGGILQKIDAAASIGAKRFLLPKGQMKYSEVVTQTIYENGLWKTISKVIERNVSEYAMQNYGMQAVEVEDINEVMLYYTGWEFSTVESNQSITTEDYYNSMKPLATSLLEKAQISYENASDLFDNTTIPNRWPDYHKNQISNFLTSAHERLIDSENWYEEKVYYTSTSKSFQSLIYSQFVTYACTYFQIDNKQEYVTDLLNHAKEYHLLKSNLSINAEINGMISLQCVGAAQKRASDAGEYLSDAQSSLNRGDYLGALYQISFALQRSESVEWWLGIADFFTDSGEISDDELQDLVEFYIQDAQQSIVYSKVILEQMRKSSHYISEAENLIGLARRNKESDYIAAAFFESLEALVKANLALELVDGIDDDKILRAKETASVKISESRNRGIEPVLAVSYYEYGESLVNESSEDAAIVYYRYSGIIAGSLGFSATTEEQSSRFIGIPQKVDISPWDLQKERYHILFVVYAIIGAIGGIGIGILISVSSMKKSNQSHGSYSSKTDSEKTSHLKQVKLDEYYAKQNTYFSEDEIPKSIKEYYKQKNTEESNQQQNQV
ncbi:MAG: S16 family serine protease [Thermoplasmatota archaeon]